MMEFVVWHLHLLNDVRAENLAKVKKMVQRQTRTGKQDQDKSREQRVPGQRTVVKFMS